MRAYLLSYIHFARSHDVTEGVVIKRSYEYAHKGQRLVGGTLFETYSIFDCQTNLIYNKITTNFDLEKIRKISLEEILTCGHGVCRQIGARFRSNEVGFNNFLESLAQGNIAGALAVEELIHTTRPFETA